MKSQTFWISGVLPGENEMINAAKALLKGKGRGGKQRTLYQIMKESSDAKVFWSAKNAMLKPVKKAFFHITYIEPNRTRDKDNIAACKKFIFDGLKKAHIIENDGWDEIAGWDEKFEVDKKCPGIRVKVVEII